MNETLFLVLLGIAFILVILFVPQLMVKRAIPKVIQAFRQNNAVGEKNAKTLEEVGLKPRGLLENMGRLRDYKPRALQFLMSINVIQMTEEGKFYISEEDIALTRWRF